MTTPPLPAPAPNVNPETRPYWEATTRGQLILPRCRACTTVNWYPRTLCPACGSFDTEWINASGQGTIYTFTITRRGGGAYRDAAPYVLAYVELAEGPRMMTNIIDCDIDALQIGDPVEVTFHDTGQGAALPRFRPARQ
jgi:uncharacterized protein